MYADALDIEALAGSVHLSRAHFATYEALRVKGVEFTEEPVDDVDAHYERARAAGVEVLGPPHEGLGGAQYGYSARDLEGNSARDLEGNLWTFGRARFTR